VRFAGAALSALAWGLLGLLALAGVALSTVAILASSELGRPLVARVLVRFADEAVAGRLELAGIEVLSNGGLAIRGLRAFDPDGHLVLEVDRAQVFAEVTHLRNRSIGVTVDLTGPTVLVEEEPGGGVSLARAFAPAHPRPPPAPGEAPPRDAGPGWTARVTRLTVRNGAIWWVDAAGATRLEATALNVDGRGVVGPDRTRVDLKLGGELALPVAGPLVLEVRGGSDRDLVRLGVLRARVGDTVLEGLGQLDLATMTGRAALTQVAVDRAEARALVPATGGGDDLALAAYAEADGRTATAAVSFAPRGGAGRGDVAVAARVNGPRAVGVDVALDALDPARLHAAAPRGAITLTARGGVAGASLEALRGRVTVALAPSRLRGGAVGPAEADLAVDRGSWTVRRLALAAPGLAVEGAGAWRVGGAVSARASVDGKDLAVALRNLETLLDRPLADATGRARVDLRLSGTSDAPVADATVEAPALGLGGVVALGARATVHLAGPLATVGGTVDATADRLRSGPGSDVARALFARLTLERGDAHLAASASVPSLGRDPVTIDGRARREGARGETLRVSELTVGYPGTRYALVAPATVQLEGPAVDRLELASGAQRLALEGGLGKRRALDARLRVSALRLEALPAGVLPERDGLSGAVDLDLRARGTLARPVVEGTVALEGGAFRMLAGLRAAGDLRWDGGTRRLVATLAAGRADGGAADVSVDAPLPLARRPGERLAVRLRGDALPVEELLRVAGSAAPAAGRLALDVRVEGTVGAPAFRGEAALSDGAWADLAAVGATLTVEAPGERVELALAAQLDGRPALEARGGVPLDLGELLARPEPTAAGLRRAPLALDVTFPGLLLDDLAGRLGVPVELGGRLTGTVHVEGTAAAPRGVASLAVAEGRWDGYAGIEARLDGRATGERVEAQARVARLGEEVVRVTGSLGAALERLASRTGLRGAPLALDAEIPGAALARAAGPDVPVAGTVRGTVTVRGTLAEPRVDADLAGTGLAIAGNALGEAQVRLAVGAAGASGTAELQAAPGGTLRATVAAKVPLGIDTPASAIRAAPAEVTLRADALALGFLPALAPNLIRAASGRLDADVTARGPLGRLSPRGKVAISGGRLAITEYGDWTGISVDATVTDDAVEIPTFVAQRGKGRLEARGALRGMSTGNGKLDGKIEANGLTLSQSGSDVATLTMSLAADGTWKPGALDVRLQVARGALVRLPKRTPRTLQPLEKRADIVVGPRRREKPATGRATAVPAVAVKPFAFTARVVAPGRLQVQGENPFVRVELKADATYELVGKDDYLSGVVEVVRGDVEPISGRRFEIRRGKVTFTGGPPRAALLDVEAVYQNPAAVVTVNVAGPVSDPEIRLTSQPAMDESQIALLIATGRLELKPGAGGVQGFGADQTGWATAGALVATELFREVIQDRLPLDTVSLDAAALRAGKYVTDRIYVGYTHRFDARPELGQNPDEVRVEYQITPRWGLEFRYGNAQSGGGSLIWAKDY
jgi:translocation and assembly module TamB